MRKMSKQDYLDRLNQANSKSKGGDQARLKTFIPEKDKKDGEGYMFKLLSPYMEGSRNYELFGVHRSLAELNGGRWVFCKNVSTDTPYENNGCPICEYAESSIAKTDGKTLKENGATKEHWKKFFGLKLNTRLSTIISLYSASTGHISEPMVYTLFQDDINSFVGFILECEEKGIDLKSANIIMKKKTITIGIEKDARKVITWEYSISKTTKLFTQEEVSPMLEKIGSATLEEYLAIKYLNDVDAIALIEQFRNGMSIDGRKVLMSDADKAKATKIESASKLTSPQADEDSEYASIETISEEDELLDEPPKNKVEEKSTVPASKETARNKVASAVNNNVADDLDDLA